MVDDEAKRLAAAIFERVTAGRILRDGTTGAHSSHDAAASLEAARAFTDHLKLIDRRRSRTDRRVIPFDQRHHSWTGIDLCVTCIRTHDALREKMRDGH
jgi:hypothetical protein